MAKTPVSKSKSKSSSSKSTLTKTALKTGKELLLGKGKGTKHKRQTVKQMLKKAYDRRAKRKIRMGNLGGAKKDLRQKVQVI